MRNFLLLVCLLTITACSSAKKSASNNDLDNSNLENNPQALMLNGSSDLGAAGDLQTLYFQFNSSELAAQSTDALAQNAAFLSKNSRITILIEGHADERGSTQYNLALGEKRAKRVRDWLISRGITVNRLSIVSFGKEKNVEYGHEESAWSKNRRANFVIMSLKWLITRCQGGLRSPNKDRKCIFFALAIIDSPRLLI